jgi:hypothetical protein
MIRARRVGRWFLMTTLLVGVCTSCNETGPSGDYTSIEGVYTCQESSPHAGLRQYPFEIDKVNDSENLYIIVNFHNKGESEFLYAELDIDTLRITNQVISNIRVDGFGLVDKEFRSIQINYLTDDGTALLDYYSSYSR